MVFVYRILGLLLTMSPIHMKTSLFDFPYSFLGITLYVLVLVLNPYKKKYIIDILLWVGMGLSIFLNYMISYQWSLNCFLLYYFIVSGMKLTDTVSQLLIFCGLVLSVASFFVPPLYILGFGLLIVLLVIQHLTKNKTKFTDCEIEVSQDIATTTIPNRSTTITLLPEMQKTVILKENFDTIQDTLSTPIPLGHALEKIQEAEFVIPNSQIKK